MNWNNSEPGSIFPTVTYQANHSEKLEVKNMLINSLKMLSSDSTIGITMENGIIDGITVIQDPSDAVNKQYIINSKKPSGPVDSLQYNDNGVFNGSNKLLFNGDFSHGSLITKGINISDSIVVIGSDQILNVEDPIYNTQLASKHYVDNFENYTNTLSFVSSVSEIYPTITNTIVRRNVPNGITTVQDYFPTAQKAFITLTDSDIQVNAATTVNISLTGLQTIDGVLLVVGNYVLVKNQTNLVENGIYIVSSGSWSRLSLSGITVPSIFGTIIYVLTGTVNADLVYTTSNTAYDSNTGTDKLVFEQLSLLRTGFFYDFCIVNESTTATLTVSPSSTNSGMNLIQYTNFSSTNSIILLPNYISTGVLTITGLVPPAMSVLLTSNKQGIKYIDSNFVSGSFQTNLSYRITDTFMLPGPSTVITNTSANYLYTATDIANNIVIRNPGSNSNDGIDNVMRNGSFSIQNISANTINISGTNSVGVWTYDPSPIVIGPSKVQTIILYTENGQNYATGLGQMDY